MNRDLAFRLIIFAGDTTATGPVEPVVAQLGLGVDWCEPRDGRLLRFTLTAEEVCSGTAATVPSALVAADPTIVFEGWEDPGSECPGTYTSYVPDLGPVSSDCDADGNIVVAGQVLLDTARSDSDLRTMLRELVGSYHRAAIDAFRKGP